MARTLDLGIAGGDELAVHFDDHDFGILGLDHLANIVIADRVWLQEMVMGTLGLDDPLLEVEQGRQVVE